jgi:hypothetical protein
VVHHDNSNHPHRLEEDHPHNNLRHSQILYKVNEMHSFNISNRHKTMTMI